MKSTLHIKILSLVLVLSMLFSLTSCVFDEWGEDIADNVINNATAEFDSSKNDPLPFNPNGTTLYETVILEDLLKENILTEDILREGLLSQLLLQEELLAEDVLIENLSVQIIDSFDDLEDYFICESNYIQQLDYSFIHQRIAQGASMVIAEVVIDLGSCVLDIVTANWGGLWLDVGQIVITAGGTAWAAFVTQQVALAKSLAAGNSYEFAMYDALDASSKAFYYTAVTCEVVNTVISLAQTVVGIVQTVKGIKNLVAAAKAGEILDDAGKVAAKVGSDGTVQVKQGSKWIKCDYAANSTDLYDVVTKEYVASIVRSGDAAKIITKQIPENIYSASGNLKYICNGSDIWKVTQTQSGNIVKTYKGTVDAGGFIKNGFGQIIDKIDFSTGKSIDAFLGIAKTAPNVSADVFGNIVDLNTGANLTTKVVDGIATYFDSAGNAVLKQYNGADGATYLKRLSDIDNGKTIGRLLDDGKHLDPNWKIDLDKIRYDATQAFRKGLVKYVQEHSLSEIRANFPELTLEQIEYIQEFGKVPTSLQIHHCKNVANYPDLAGDMKNLEVLSQENHLKAHGMNFQNSTSSRSPNYVDVTQFPEFGG